MRRRGTVACVLNIPGGGGKFSILIRLFRIFCSIMGIGFNIEV